jgi:hypothetical protein
MIWLAVGCNERAFARAFVIQAGMNETPSEARLEGPGSPLQQQRTRLTIG